MQLALSGDFERRFGTEVDFASSFSHTPSGGCVPFRKRSEQSRKRFSGLQRSARFVTTDFLLPCGIDRWAKRAMQLIEEPL